jgi:hypothetical protein
MLSEALRTTAWLGDAGEEAFRERPRGGRRQKCHHDDELEHDRDQGATDGGET